MADQAIGLYSREIKVLTEQAKIELTARITKVDKKAREQVIKAKLPLVVKIARGFESNCLLLLDLQRGKHWPNESRQTIDPAQGKKLVKYRSMWIKHS